MKVPIKLGYGKEGVEGETMDIRRVEFHDEQKTEEREEHSKKSDVF